jgi:hypothetical protein
MMNLIYHGRGLKSWNEAILTIGQFHIGIVPLLFAASLVIITAALAWTTSALV